jgi:hypothetical protein
MHDTALTEIKALLTLALLKSGTCARDIQNAIDVAATTRLIAGEECAAPHHDDGSIADGRITNIRDLRHGDTAAASRERKRRQPISGLNGDVKALLSLLLLQHGATSREILTTLRMAAATSVQEDCQDDEQAELEQPKTVATVLATPRQRLRNEHLAPIDRAKRVA